MICQTRVKIYRQIIRNNIRGGARLFTNPAEKLTFTLKSMSILYHRRSAQADRIFISEYKMRRQLIYIISTIVLYS